MSHSKNVFSLLVLVLIWFPFQFASAQEPTPTSETLIPPMPAEVIDAVNALRLSNGLPALAVHSVLMQVAQEEANGIASGQGGHWRPPGVTLGQWLILLGYPLFRGPFDGRVSFGELGGRLHCGGGGQHVAGR